MKKLAALALAMMMLLSIAATALAQSPEIVVEIWHTRGAGANLEVMEASVKTFNETIGKEKGIRVDHVFQGPYIETMTKTMNAIAANEPPEMVVLERAAGVPVMAAEGVLADLGPYVEKSNLDLDNFAQILLAYSYDQDGQLISLPYIRSTPVFYYNKTMWDAAGLVAPATIDELIAAGKQLTKMGANGETDVYGFQLLNDPAWFIQNMLVQLGSNIFTEDGLSVPALEDGTMLKTLSAWREWVDEGWCAPFVSTSAADAMYALFNQGRLASFMQSCGSMANIIKNASEAPEPFEVGVAFLPTWDKPAAPTGGGNIAMISEGNDTEHLDAAWEFINFLMSDEQVAYSAAKTGYLPSTKTSTNAQILQDLYAKYPQYKVAFDQLENGQEIPYSQYKDDFEKAWRSVCSLLIQDRSITAEEAVQMLKDEASIIFP